MRKFIKSLTLTFLVLVSTIFVACNQEKSVYGEKISLAKTVFREVEFENSDKVKIEQEENQLVVSGEIESMSDAQKSAFGVEGVSHVVVLKFVFDKERTIDYFKIEGETIKVFSTDKNDKNYVGSISGLLDNEGGEDAFCYLILSANTKEYVLTSRYTDDVETKIELKIDATLVKTEPQE